MEVPGDRKGKVAVLWRMAGGKPVQRPQGKRQGKALAAGGDPVREKQQAKHRAKMSVANTFGEIAQEFINKRRREGARMGIVGNSRSTIQARSCFVNQEL